MTDITTDLYFEAHVTIDPVLDEDDRIRLDEIAKQYGFRVATLLMKKTGIRSGLDDFCTTRDTDFGEICARTFGVILELRAAGFAVQRYKIENTLLDVRF